MQYTTCGGKRRAPSGIAITACNCTDDETDDGVVSSDLKTAFGGHNCI